MMIALEARYPLPVRPIWRLTPTSAEQVRAYRARRWPELLEEALTP